MKLKDTYRNKNENNKEYAYRVLKTNIINLNLAPGENINEVEISKILDVSRTPVREAFVRLSEEKLIKVFPQKGSIVSKINLELVEEAIFLRKLCEQKLFIMVCEDENSDVLISQLEKNIAYQKIAANFDNDLYKFFELDNRFHMSIFEYYKKKNIWKGIENLCTHYDRLRLLDSFEEMNFEEIIKQHKKIIELFKQRDKDRVNEVVSNHLYNYKKNIKKFMKNHPTFFE